MSASRPAHLSAVLIAVVVVTGAYAAVSHADTLPDAQAPPQRNSVAGAGASDGGLRDAGDGGRPAPEITLLRSRIDQAQDELDEIARQTDAGAMAVDSLRKEVDGFHKEAQEQARKADDATKKADNATTVGLISGLGGGALGAGLTFMLTVGRDWRAKRTKKTDARRLMCEFRRKLKKVLAEAGKVSSVADVRAVDKSVRATISFAEWSKTPIYEATPLEWRWSFELLMKYGYHLRDFIELEGNRTNVAAVASEAVTVESDLAKQEKITFPADLRKVFAEADTAAKKD